MKNRQKLRKTDETLKQNETVLEKHISGKESFVFVAIVLVIFSVVSLIMILRHEPWRDEAQAWLIVRDHPEPFSMFKTLQYEGTPALWYFVLWLPVKLGLPFFSMAVINFLIMLASVFLILYAAPFSRLQKIFLVFGYYLLYEYNIIARSYSLSVLLLFLLAFTYKNRTEKPWLYLVLLGLLINTNVHSLVIGLVLFLFFSAEVLFMKKEKPIRFILPLTLFILCSGAAVFPLLPPPDPWPVVAGWNFNKPLQNMGFDSLMVFANGFLPVSKADMHYWNRLFIGDWGLPFLIVLSLFVVIVLFTLLKDRKVPLLLFITVACGLLGIFLFKYFGSFRHHGLVFVFFVFCLWIQHEYVPVPRNHKHGVFSATYRNYALSLLLSIQFVASLTPLFFDYTYDFSAGKKMADYLISHDLLQEGHFIAAWQAPNTSSILPYLPDSYNKFYHPEYQDFGSFTIWNRQYHQSAANFRHNPMAVFQMIDDATKQKNYDKVFLITNFKFRDNYIPFGSFQSLRLLVSFDDNIREDENQYLYQLTKRLGSN